MPDTPVVARHPQQDPTALTTEKVQREIEQAVELLRAELRAEAMTIDTRLASMDKALELLQARADGSATVGEIQERFDGLKAVLVEIDKRYQAEFIKLSTTTEMMVKQQEMALAATKEAVALAMDAAEKAVTKAETSAEKRFASINEFRQQLADQQATFARTDMVSQRAEGLDRKVDDMRLNFEARNADTRDRIAAVENQVKGASTLWGFLLGGAGLVLVLIGFIYSMR